MIAEELYLLQIQWFYHWMIHWSIAEPFCSAGRIQWIRRRFCSHRKHPSMKSWQDWARVLGKEPVSAEPVYTFQCDATWTKHQLSFKFLRTDGKEAAYWEQPRNDDENSQSNSRRHYTSPTWWRIWWSLISNLEASLEVAMADDNDSRGDAEAWNRLCQQTQQKRFFDDTKRRRESRK